LNLPPQDHVFCERRKRVVIQLTAVAETDVSSRLNCIQGYW
jgi:hypothetical protein